MKPKPITRTKEEIFQNRHLGRFSMELFNCFVYESRKSFWLYNPSNQMISLMKERMIFYWCFKSSAKLLKSRLFPKTLKSLTHIILNFPWSMCLLIQGATIYWREWHVLDEEVSACCTRYYCIYKFFSWFGIYYKYLCVFQSCAYPKWTHGKFTHDMSIYSKSQQKKTPMWLPSQI